ncbi:MAG TPA: TIGR03435 family protein [Acidobacteriaceae bacterium]|nr:TIGR03435 family protein [Acidobacteriaceae bacterium]
MLSIAARGQSSQTQASPVEPPAPVTAPVFDVAAIHINKSDTSARTHIISSSSNGRFTAINASLKSLVQWAFVMPDSRILGGPGWFSSTRFDIEAKADDSVDTQLSALPSSAGKAEKQAMLRALLADRFQLKSHQETRELPVYALVLAKDGPKFQPSQVNGTTVNGRPSEISVSGSDDTMALLADELGKRLGRVVTNETGLHGRYELSLKWASDQAVAPQPGDASSSAGALGPSIFTAIREQLGLRLIPKKSPISVLVIDGASMPAEN